MPRMAIPLKSPRDIDAMRRAGAVLWGVLSDAAASARPGTTTRALDALIAGRIRSAGAEPVMRAAGFPGAASITLNEEVVHAPPGPRILRGGDIATIDASLRLDGWCVDAATTVRVGTAWHSGVLKLQLAATEALSAAIAVIAPGRRWSEVAEAAAGVARRATCSLVVEYAGHGIGRNLHEPPAAPFHWDSGGDGSQPVALPVPPIRPDSGGHPPPARQDFILRPGMVLTIEPVLVLGRPEVLGLDDAWTVVTADRSAAAHEERTVAVTRGGALVLTAP